MPFEEKTSPTVANQHLFTILKIIVEMGMHVEVNDKKCAFLKAKMDKPTFAWMPKEIADRYVLLKPNANAFLKEKGMLTKLERAVYGMPQSGKLCFESLSTFLLKTGFRQNKKDPCIFQMTRNGEIVLVAFHVDDILSASKSQENLDWFR